MWSLVSWAVHAVLGLDPARLDDLEPLIAEWPYADELDLWLPGWERLVQLVLDITQNLLAGIHSAAPWIAWAVWGVGCTLVVFVAAVATHGARAVPEGCRSEQSAAAGCPAAGAALKRPDNAGRAPARQAHRSFAAAAKTASSRSTQGCCVRASVKLARRLFSANWWASRAPSCGSAPKHAT